MPHVYSVPDPGMENGTAPLTRTFTAPNPPTNSSSHMRPNNSTSSSIAQYQSHPASQYSNFSHPSRSSGSTQDTSASTLFQSHGSFPQNPHGGSVGPSNNVINKVADKGTSLFQICLNLRNRLRGIPEFEEQLRATEEDAGDDEPWDPVSLLWSTFRRGYPLMAIYNTLRPDKPLEVDETKVPEARREKTAAFKFLHACVHDLKFPTEECFIITDLYGEDTSGFVKVAKVVNRVADILVEEGLLESFDRDNQVERAIRTHRQHVVDELVRTERTYVQHLEVLQSFKKRVEQRGIISGDAIHDIFLNLNALLDFQRRFLIRVEQINAAPEEQQNWGRLFMSFAGAFKVYEPYIANQKKCEETAMREFDKLKDIGGPLELRQMVESPTHLTSFLLKPFQRLSKYPLLLRELRDKGDLDEDRRLQISEAIEAITSVLERTNAWIANEERQEAVRYLKESVEDWKNHAFDGFGDLLLWGTHTVIKGDATNAEREYQMYLFEKILLCCKEANPNKQKGRLMNRPAPPPDKKGRPKLVLKGRIFMQNVTETVFLAKPGSYTCQIFWRGDVAIEYFIIKFSTEETMKKWREAIERQRRICKEQARLNQHPSTSETEFTYIREQGQLENPYQDDAYQEGDDLGEDGYDDYYDYQSSNNGSTSSLLRSRSNTGESGPPMIPNGLRTAANRYPPTYAGQPLTLRTQQLQNEAAASYFSPSVESPLSSRTSSSSFNMPYPRQATPSNNQHHPDEHNRFTAPAMGRTYDPRTGKPTATPPPLLAQSRMRSASSPDIHVQNLPGRRTAANAPPVPVVPSHLATQPPVVNRSQNNSPTYGNGVPPRIASQSPNAKRQVSQQQQQLQQQAQYGYDGTDGRDVATPVPGQAPARITTQSIGSRSSLGNDPNAPSQLKVKVKIPSEGTSLILVVSFNISFQSLKDRIDAKLQRSTNLSLASGIVKLKYVCDDDYISIETDEDVQTAFETWREQQQDYVLAGQMGEIELFCILQR